MAIGKLAEFVRSAEGEGTLKDLVALGLVKCAHREKLCALVDGTCQSMDNKGRCYQKFHTWRDRLRCWAGSWGNSWLCGRKTVKRPAFDRGTDWYSDWRDAWHETHDRQVQPGQRKRYHAQEPWLTSYKYGLCISNLSLASCRKIWQVVDHRHILYLAKSKHYIP